MSCFGLKAITTVAAAFVQPLPAIRNVGQHVVTLTSMPRAAPQLPAMATTSALMFRGGPSATTSTTAIGMTVMNPSIQAAAMSFFTGVRIPATLIAGTSFAALFTMTDKGRDTSGLSTTEILLLRLYHVLSLLSLCFSIITVVMSTSAGTMLMLQKYQPSSSHVDVYRFLRECMDLEFSLTRFGFLTSVLCFLSAVTGRIIIEFDLWTRKRRLAGFMVLSKMIAILTLLLSYANTSVQCWENLFFMGVHVAKLLWQRAAIDRYPLQIVSMVSFGVSALCAIIFFLPSSAHGDKMRDHESYI